MRGSGLAEIARGLRGRARGRAMRSVFVRVSQQWPGVLLRADGSRAWGSAQG